jgi:hypothetical protein
VSRRGLVLNGQVGKGDGVSRRRTAVVSLLAFVVCTVLAAVLSGERPATGQGIAPLVVQGVGYGFLLVAVALLLAPAGSATDCPAAARVEGRVGGVLLGALVLLVFLDVVTYSEAGADVGAALARLVVLVVVVGATARLGAVPSRSR